MTTFKVSIGRDITDDLKRRIRATRFPDQIEGSGQEYGMDTAYLQEIVGYWAEEFDWGAQQDRLNQFHHYRVEIDGMGIHYIHEKSAVDGAIPLLLLHGWPSSFVQMLDVMPMLTRSEGSYPVFHTVVASLPGYGFSDIPASRGMSVSKIAPILHKLMTEVLGYGRYGLRSSDLGAGVAGAIAAGFPDAIIGSHTGGTNPWLQGPIPDDLTEEERKFVDDAQAWMQSEMAYAQLHSTKPQTVAVALNDSPTGLAAWIGEKFCRWTDNHGRIEDAISRDSFLTNLTIYWATGTINSSMRLYFETVRDQSGWGKAHVPKGCLMPVKDMFRTPRSWVERQGPIAHWTETDRGGHFIDWEEPELVARDLKTFFGLLR